MNPPVIRLSMLQSFLHAVSPQPDLIATGSIRGEHEVSIEIR